LDWNNDGGLPNGWKVRLANREVEQCSEIGNGVRPDVFKMYSRKAIRNNSRLIFRSVYRVMCSQTSKRLEATINWMFFPKVPHHSSRMAIHLMINRLSELFTKVLGNVWRLCKDLPTKGDGLIWRRTSVFAGQGFEQRPTFTGIGLEAAGFHFLLPSLSLRGENGFRN
jgi:hypothetical protein